MKKKITLFIIQLIPIIVFIFLWEFLLHNNKQLIFYFGLPSKILGYLILKIGNGTLIIDFFTTLSETLIGFLFGNILGATLGLLLWFSNRAFIMSKPYIVALGSAPIFALAPLIIIWFGTGIYSKIIITTFSTIFVALFQSYSGASSVDKNHIKLMKSFNASKMQIFKKVIVPSSIVWVISAFRMNISFALLGAFIGEYISSDKGLGHLILVASGLFDISLVLTGVLMMMIIALSLNYFVQKLEIPIKKMIVNSL